ncbi:MAG: hypothetical protein IJ054_07465 [Lachnospiraceae bacterium]|nr:hypothetical protein [Lachnospiraceae bacterium]MBQ9233443.1 hypothetical protein [Lachnospiraceae bacterium]
MALKKLMVEFPGRNYSTDKPLLYYAGSVFEQKGYEVIRLSYNYKLLGDKNDIEGLIEEAKAYIKKELDKVDFSVYDDVVFISKSMGTTLAGFFEEYYKIRVRHIFLTPVQSALKYMKRGKCIVVAGKNDKFLDNRRLKIYCVEQDVALKQFDDVGHSLESEDINVTFAILMVIVKLYKGFSN